MFALPPSIEKRLKGEACEPLLISVLKAWLTGAKSRSTGRSTSINRRFSGRRADASMRSQPQSANMAKTGPILMDRFGQPKAHPATLLIRDSRGLFAGCPGTGAERGDHRRRAPAGIDRPLQAPEITMPIRRKTSAQHVERREMTREDEMRAFLRGINDDFTEDLLGPAFPTRKAAERAWPRCRRDVWRRSHRMTIPDPAKQFDGLSASGWDLIFTAWNHTRFPLTRTLAALARDRAAVSAFEARDPKAAQAIAGYLAEWGGAT